MAGPELGEVVEAQALAELEGSSREPLGSSREPGQEAGEVMEPARLVAGRSSHGGCVFEAGHLDPQPVTERVHASRHS